MSSKPVPKIDPLLAALIDKLPKPGDEFPAGARTKWLAMAAMAFDVAYGPSAEPVELPGFAEQRAAAGTATAPIAAPKVSAPVHGGFEFYVDRDGFARRASDNEQINAGDIPSDEMIYDGRTGPARNRETIVWANGEMGAVPGMAFCGPG